MLNYFFLSSKIVIARYSRMVSLTSSLCATLTALTMLLILFANFFFEANFGTCESSKWSNFPDFATQHHVSTSDDSQRYLTEQNLIRRWGFYLWQKSPICHEFLIRDMVFSEKLCSAHICRGQKSWEKKINMRRALTSNVICLKVVLSVISTFNSITSKFIRT